VLQCGRGGETGLAWVKEQPGFNGCCQRLSPRLQKCGHVRLQRTQLSCVATPMSMPSLCCRCRTQLSGENLVPFTFDKQILFLDTILGLFL